MKIGKHIIKLVISDMDGVMFDTERLAYKIWKELGRKYNYEINKSIYKKTIGLNSKKAKQIYREHFGDSFPHEEMLTKERKIMRNHILSKGAPLKEGLYELLDYIKSKKLKIALVTSSGKKKTELLLDLSDTKKYFDVITCGDEITSGKPDPEIFIRTAQKVGCLPENCMVLEDSENGIRAAYRAGMLPVMIPDISEPEEEIKEMLFKKFSSLKEVRDYLKNNLKA
jgi:HAD superfamily hydrolase (TIGR01509 family)